LNTARQLLDDLAVIGATVEQAGDRLILRAGPTAIPGALVNRVREAKGDLITMLRGLNSEQQKQANKSPDHKFPHQTSEACIVEWLNEHPAPSPPGRCAWCGRTESLGTVVLPFGTERETHTWLHAKCWPSWHQARRVEAIAALGAMGIAGTIMSD
jgi:hypothetical protein